MSDQETVSNRLALGKKPATRDKRDLLFENYDTNEALPPVPRTFGHERLVPTWGMLANDRIGLCTCAGAAHQSMLWCAEVGKVATFDDKCVIANYSELTGYVPGDESTDNGANIRDLLNFWRKTGIKDATGKRHKIGGFVALRPGDTDQLLKATYIFGAPAIGFEMPASAMDQFAHGKPWTVVRKSPIEGGHYVPAVACRGAGLLGPMLGSSVFGVPTIGDSLLGSITRDIVVVTWGKLQLATLGFYGAYNDETYAILSEEMVNDEGKTIDGFDLATLRRDLQAVAA